MIKVILKKGREASVYRKHPWIFFGGIHKIEGKPKDGDVVQVVDFEDQILGAGHYQNGSIMVRLCQFGNEEKNSLQDQSFWEERFSAALNYRKQWVLPYMPNTDCYRLIHGEGDGFPGLIIDIYASTAVVQCHSIGMHRQLEFISDALQEVFVDQLKTIFSKSGNRLPVNYASTNENSFLKGDAAAEWVKEHDHEFWVDWQEGQKTGFFLDQRANRKHLAGFAAGKTVLNTFCYSGGFSVYAIGAKAKAVTSVDISQKAMDWTDKNIARNNPDNIPHTSHTDDVLGFFKAQTEQHHIVIVDPPAYAKKLDKKHKAVQGYRRLNTEAFKAVKPGGLMYTFSCSQVIDAALFYNTIVAAGHKSRRNVRVMERLGQPADHPVNLYHPEGNYLKGLLLSVD